MRVHDRSRRLRESNRAVGQLIVQLRKRAELSPHQVLAAIPRLTEERLLRLEEGREEIEADTFFELVNLYRGNWVEIEISLARATARIRSARQRLQKRSALRMARSSSFQ